MMERASGHELPSVDVLPAEDPSLAGTSSSLGDLLRRVLDPRPESRASVLEILSHPWFKYVS